MNFTFTIKLQEILVLKLNRNVNYSNQNTKTDFLIKRYIFNLIIAAKAVESDYLKRRITYNMARFATNRIFV